MSSVYRQLAKAPSANYIRDIVMINGYEFIAITAKGWGTAPKHGIYKYNSKTDEWTLIMLYPEDFKSTAHRFCYDSINNIIYLAGLDKRLYIFNLDERQMNIIENVPYLGCNPSLLMINNQCHIILGSRSQFHWKYNSETKKIDKISQFTHLSAGLHKHGIVHIKSKNMLLLFGGYDPDQGHQFDDIWKFDLSQLNKDYKENKWIKIDDIKLPLKMSSFAWILSKNENYLVTFSGYSKAHEKRIKNIFILNLKENKFYCSKVQWTKNRVLNAVLMHDQCSDVLIAGFIRKISDEYNINIPPELMYLFAMYIVSETVHLIDPNCHYAVELNDILNDMTEDLTTIT